MELAKVVAGNVMKVRQKRGWTQEELAKRTGLALAFINRVEKQDVNLTLKTLGRLSDGLGVSPSDLFAGTELKTPERLSEAEMRNALRLIETALRDLEVHRAS